MVFIYEIRIKHRHTNVYYHDNHLHVRVERASCSKLKYYASEAEGRTSARSLFPSARTPLSLSLCVCSVQRATHLFTHRYDFTQNVLETNESSVGEKYKTRKSVATDDLQDLVCYDIKLVLIV